MDHQLLKDMTDFYVMLCGDSNDQLFYQDVKRDLGNQMALNTKGCQVYYFAEISKLFQEKAWMERFSQEGETFFTDAAEQLKSIFCRLHEHVFWEQKEKENSKKGVFRKLFHKVKDACMVAFHYLVQNFGLEENSISKDVLEQYSKSDNPFERRAVASHKNASMELLKLLINDSDRKVAEFAYCQIADRFFFDCKQEIEEKQKQMEVPKGGFFWGGKEVFKEKDSLEEKIEKAEVQKAEQENSAGKEDGIIKRAGMELS